MKKILLLLILTIASCATQKPSDIHNIKGIVHQIDGKKYRAVYVCVDSTKSIKVCNYVGSKNVNDSISITYTATKYQNEFISEDK